MGYNGNKDCNFGYGYGSCLLDMYVTGGPSIFNPFKKRYSSYKKGPKVKQEEVSVKSSVHPFGHVDERFTKPYTETTVDEYEYRPVDYEDFDLYDVNSPDGDGYFFAESKLFPGEDDEEEKRVYSIIRDLANAQGRVFVPSIEHYPSLQKQLEETTSNTIDWYKNRRFPMTGTKYNGELDDVAIRVADLDDNAGQFMRRAKVIEIDPKYVNAETVSHELRHQIQSRQGNDRFNFVSRMFSPRKSFGYTEEDARILNDAYPRQANISGVTSYPFSSIGEQASTNTEKAYYLDKTYGEDVMDDFYNGKLKNNDKELYEEIRSDVLFPVNLYDEIYYKKSMENWEKEHSDDFYNDVEYDNSYDIFEEDLFQKRLRALKDVVDNSNKNQYSNYVKDGGPILDKNKVYNRMEGNALEYNMFGRMKTPVLALSKYLFEKDDKVQNEVNSWKKDIETIESGHKRWKENYDNYVANGGKGSYNDYVNWVLENRKQKLGLEDAKDMYLCMPQRSNSIEVSKYRPSVGDNGETYYASKYMRDPLFVDNYLIPSYTNIVEGNVVDEFKKPGDIYGIGKSGKNGNTLLPIFGNATVGVGRDDNGDYISYADKWDVELSGNSNGEDNFVSKLVGGKPVNFYDRIYFDDYYDVPFENRVPNSYYIPPVTVKQKKQDGGDNNNENNVNPYIFVLK